MALAVSMETYLTVQEMLGRYCWYVDEGKGDEWAALYTEDGIFEGTRPDPVIGREALTQVSAQIWAHSQGKMRHQFGNLVVEPGEDENRLVAKFYNQVTLWGPEGGKLLILAVSTAQLVRADGNAPWKIARNTIFLPR